MSDNRSYLKNLSQKKYAWMETAVASTSSPPPLPQQQQQLNSTSPLSSDSTDVPKRKDPVTSPKSRKKQKQKESPSSTSSATSGMSTPVDSTIIKIPKVEMNQSDHITNNSDDGKNNRTSSAIQPNFKYTNFPLKGYTILPTRNITSNFVRSDASQIKGHKAGDEAICPNEEEEWHDTIIIHPGSRNLRVGLASEAYPITVPHVIARRLTTPTKAAMEVDEDEDQDTQEQEDIALAEMRNELNWRMKNAKRRTLPNADNQVISFNSNAPKETIPDHNDPYRVEWIDFQDTGALEDVYVAEKALKVPVDTTGDYQLFYPWKNGTFNRWDYTSLYAVLGDLQAIWTSVIRSELEIEDLTFENFNAVVVVPDGLDRPLVSHLITMMLEHMKFKGVIAQQASTCATFGAGVSSACVVDIGAQTTNIACIDEGVQLLDSRMTINLGGDDITRTFTSFLMNNQFPYHDLNLARSYDWRLVEDLKEKWCTMNEAEISVQVYDFFVRAPHQHTYKYECKVYDEVFLAPLCLVYPNVLKHKNTNGGIDGFVSNGVLDDIADEFNGPTNVSAQSAAATSSAAKLKQAVQSPRPSEGLSPAPTPSSDIATPTTTTNNGAVQRTNTNELYPIDVGIALAIQAASGNSDDRLKRFFTNIIVVGGGAKINNFDRVLEDRLLSTAVARTCKVDDVEVLPAPREMDPQILVWKGASVLCKLDMSKDMWIGETEWTECGSRLLRDRSLLLF